MTEMEDTPSVITDGVSLLAYFQNQLCITVSLDFENENSRLLGVTSGVPTHLCFSIPNLSFCWKHVQAPNLLSGVFITSFLVKILTK